MPPKKVNITKAIKMKVQGASYQDIADSQGVAKQSIQQAIKPILDMVADPETLESYRAQQAAVMDTIAMAYGSRLLDGDAIKGSSALQAASVMGICIDKSRLISGQSTSNSLIIHASASDTACTRWGDGHVLDTDPTD